MGGVRQGVGTHDPPSQTAGRAVELVHRGIGLEMMGPHRASMRMTLWDGGIRPGGVENKRARRIRKA